VKIWNEQYEWPRFHISSTSDAFSAVEKLHGKRTASTERRPHPYWEDGAGSSALETGMNRTAADRLTQAEAMAAMLAPDSYQPAAFREAWRNILLYSEHTWGAWCSVSDSENILTTKQWEVKREFAVNAQKQSRTSLLMFCGHIKAARIVRALMCTTPRPGRELRWLCWQKNCPVRETMSRMPAEFRFHHSAFLRASWRF